MPDRRRGGTRLVRATRPGTGVLALVAAHRGPVRRRPRDDPRIPARRARAALGAWLAPALLLAACGGEPPPEPARADEWLALDAGRRWTYEVDDGSARLRRSFVVEGSDVRDLPGAGRVPFDFVYGRSPGEDGPTSKSVYARAPDGPRLFYLDAGAFEVGFDPPLPLLPPRPSAGAAWTWTGRLSVDREGRPSTARLRVEAVERVSTPAGDLDALRVRQTHEPPSVEATWWYARGVGLVRLRLSGPPPGERVRGLTLLEHAPPPPAPR